VVLLQTWGHEKVPCPFFSRPGKKQLRACGVFRKKVTVVKGSCLRAAEIENVAVRATGRRQVLPKIKQICSRNVSDDEASVRREVLGRSAVFKWHKYFAQGRGSLEDDEHTGRPRTGSELRIQEVATVVHASRSQTVDGTAAAGTSQGTCHKILSGDLNMSRVTQHSVPRVLRQDQRDDRMSICGDLIDSGDKDETFLNRS
jgi:hypothetical protein